MIVAACQVIISCARGHFRVIRNCAAIMTLRCANGGGSREQGAESREQGAGSREQGRTKEIMEGRRKTNLKLFFLTAKHKNGVKL